MQIDSYSAFNDNGEFRQTPLHNILKNHGIRLVVVAGLALDYCVYFTSKDAVKLGKVMIEECIILPASLEKYNIYSVTEFF